MGKPGSKSTAVIAVDVDETGQVRYDAIVKQGTNKDKIVRSTLADMKEKSGDEDKLALPEEDEEQAIADKTKLALEVLLDGKIKKAKPTTIQAPGEAEEPTYIRYTPNPNAPG
jgi:SNW domain-containing protein 1